MSETTRLFEKEMKGDVMVLTFTPANIDQSNVDSLLEQMMREIETGTCRGFLLDFRNVQYISSIVLGNFVLFRKQLEEAGQKLKLCNLSPIVRNLFKITKLDHLFTISNDLDKALEPF